jgi:hypothetical protein
MTKMTASASVSNGSLWLFLDNELILKNSGVVNIELKDSGEHIVHWFVSGKGTYTISVSSPKEAEFHLTKMLNSSGKEIDSFTFRN